MVRRDVPIRRFRCWFGAGTIACGLIIGGTPSRPAFGVPVGTAPPAVGLSTTGDASNTVVRPSYSPIGQTAQQRVSWSYDLAEDGARGDAASDTAALTRALLYAAAHPGTVIHFPAGTWALTSPGVPGFVVPSNTVIEGASRAGTILTWNDQAASVAATPVILFGSGGSPSAGSQTNVTFRDFTVLGQENVVPPGASTEYGSASYLGYPFLLYFQTGLRFENVGVMHSRIMSIVVRDSVDVTVNNCLVQYSSRDGISVGSSANVSITDNVVEHAGDDAIAVHSATGEPWGARRDAIITGNRIFDAQGINASSLRSGNVSGNIIDDVRSYGISIATAVPGGSGTEGNSAINDVLLSDNVITNVVSRKDVDGLTSGAADIVLVGQSARAGSYTAVPGTPGSDGVVHPPYAEFLANATSTSTPVDASSGIIVSHNILGRMIPPTDGTDSRFNTWTDLKFGPIWVQDRGNLSPSLPQADITAIGVQMYGGTFRDVQITDNLITGVSTGLELDQASNYGTVVFRGNNVMDTAGFGGVLINTSGKGQLIADSNLFDLDPYFTNPSRGSNGTWKDQNGPAGFYSQSSAAMGVLARENIVRNAGSDSNVSTASPPANWTFLDNIVQADPNAIGGYDPSNKGVGLVRQTGGFALVQVDSDPTSATYGQVLNNAAMTHWNGPPGAGKWLQGQAVWNGYVGSASPCAAYIRQTSGTGNVAGTDWDCVPALVGGDLHLPADRSVNLSDSTSGKSGYLNLDTDGWLRFPVFSTGDGLSELKLDQLQVNAKVYLDSNRTMWVQESGGKVVIGTGTTNLFSIDGGGNVIARGAITANGSP